MTRILAVSDIERPYIYDALAAGKFKEIDFTISCGDLRYPYLEYIISMTNKPLYFVRGNHAHRPEFGGDSQSGPQGGTDLHRKTARAPGGILLAGIQGSIAYNYGPYQYSQGQYALFALGLAPKLLLNGIRFGRFLDILVTHAPPWQINDLEDRPHTGIKAFRWLIRTFRPKYHLHGHTRDYLAWGREEAEYAGARVVNVTGYRVIELKGDGEA